MMDQVNQGINPDALALVPLKRKRGRPRKHPKPDLNHGGSAVAARSLNFYRAYSARIPPGFERMDGAKARQGDAFGHPNSDIVGQPVYGVIEAAFDAGYLLTVKVGNSETTLRGVVLMPGHYVPVSAENDVAPNVQMIKRNKTRFTKERKVRHRPVPNVAANPFRESVPPHASLSAPCVSNAGTTGIKPAPVMGNRPAPSLTSRGNVVPVVLQPANIASGCFSVKQVSAASSQSADLVSAPKPKQENTPVFSNLRSPAQTPNSQPAPKGALTDANLCNQSSSQMVDANSAGTESKVFEKLLAQMMKGAGSPSQKGEALSGGLTVRAHSNETDDAPMSPEPLRAIDPSNSSMFKSFERFGTGKMTELLKVR